jgi:uncharacterized protein (DUF934 family)
MTLLIKNGEACDDTFRVLGSDESLPADGDIIVPLARWQAEREALSGRAGRLGVRLKSDEPPALIADDLEHFAVVALEFPVFRDGRAYSYAHLLRDRYGYGGEIRAVGEVLLEQLHYMARVGFDAFELGGADPERDFRIASNDFSVWYQPSADDRATALELRNGGF